MTPDDLVDHPQHYRGGGMEVIDIVEAFSLNFHLGNAVKYILRYGKKEPSLMDLKKACWYLKREIERKAKLQHDDASGNSLGH